MPPATEVGVLAAGSWCLLAGLLLTGRKVLRYLAAASVTAAGAASRAGEALACLGDAAATRLLLWSAAGRQETPAVSEGRPGPFEPAPEPDGPVPAAFDHAWEPSPAELTTIDNFPPARAGAYLEQPRRWE
jgi:hypothetical protein